MTDEDRFAGYRDEFGTLAPLPASDGQRIPPGEDFRGGPEVGVRLPGLTLKSSLGGSIDLHADRKHSKAAVVFFRSAVW